MAPENLINLIHSLIESFSSRPIPVIQLAERLGEVTNDWEPGLPAVVLPHDQVFSEIQVIPEVDGSDAEQVWLRLAKPVDLRVCDLHSSFGKYHLMPGLRPGGSEKLLFDIDPHGQPFTCSLIAEVQPGRGSSMRKTVAALTIVRQIRLE